MSDSCESEMRKSKVSSESDVAMKDRIIVAGTKQFLVNSEVLASKSEYFRILFESDFKEKEQETIELNEINEESFERFLIIIERPEDFKATTDKLIDLIETLAYFNVTDLLKPILADSTNFNKIPKMDLLELARTFAIPFITEIVEDWYLDQFQVSHQRKNLNKRLKYQQLQYAVEYGMNRLETKLFHYFINHLNEYMERILNDDSELGRKVYQKIKTRVFEIAAGDNTLIFRDFTSKMNEAQFEDVKEHVENILLTHAQRKTFHELVNGFSGCIKPHHVKKMEKLEAYVTERFIRDFPRSKRKSEIFGYAKEFNYDKLMAFVIDYLIRDFRRTHCWNIIYLAIHYDLDLLKILLRNYLRQKFAKLREGVKTQMIGYRHEVDEFIREATQPELKI